MSRSFGAMSFTTRPPMRTMPSLISSSPATIRRAVDLPEPDGPTSTMNSPSSISSVSEFTAMVPSVNRFVTFSNEMFAIGVVFSLQLGKTIMPCSRAHRSD